MKLEGEQLKLAEEIHELSKEKNTVILAHNYQRPEIFEVADFVGDSYDLSVKASKTNADTIVFCGVKFMAETAKLLNPEKKVLLPTAEAGCNMADMINAQKVREWKEKYPDSSSVCYINTYAEVKAEFDACCTSANAPKVVEAMPSKQVLFAPDENLAQFAQEELKKKGVVKQVIPWNGFCFVHVAISPEQLEEAMKTKPDAEVIVHPECKKQVRDLADFVLGTSSMVRRAGESSAKEFIVGTEVGMCERLSREYPDKKFYPAPGSGTCAHMKRNDLSKTLEALEKEQHEVTVPNDAASKARACLDKMLEIGK
ncbi:MAG: quinolinate synthase NadA [Candidatus Micrarchaeia archaeon]